MSQFVSHSCVLTVTNYVVSSDSHAQTVVNVQ